MTRRPFAGRCLAKLRFALRCIAISEHAEKLITPQTNAKPIVSVGYLVASFSGVVRQPRVYTAPTTFAIPTPAAIPSTALATPTHTLAVSPRRAALFLIVFSVLVRDDASRHAPAGTAPARPARWTATPMQPGAGTAGTELECGV